MPNQIYIFHITETITRIVRVVSTNRPDAEAAAIEQMDTVKPCNTSEIKITYCGNAESGVKLIN